jgi:quinoprotein glucose dehydrogenase
VKPTGLTRDSMTRKEVSKISPEAEKYCTELFDKSINMGPFTPYGMLPSLVFPGSEGGGGWGGVSYNPTAELLFVNTRHLGVVAQLSASGGAGAFGSFGKSKIPTTFYTDPNGYPCNAPPWAELVAVSTKTGDIVWRVPLGEYPELEAKGITGTGTVGVSGAPIATSTGLLFIGASTDGMFRAFDQKTGKVLWKVAMPNNVQMTPLTYQGSNGKQFVAAIAGGGDERFNIPARPAANVELAAFALP